MNTQIFQTKKFLYSLIALLLIILVGVGGVFGYEQYQIYKAEKQVDTIHSIIDIGDYGYSSCEKILKFQSDKIDRSKINFRLGEYNDFREQCDLSFNIVKQEQTLEFCENIIKGRKSNFKENYILLDGFATVQEQCTLEYLTVTFSTGALFDVENDFKSSVHIDFGLPFYEDTDDINSEEFIENRTRAKERLISLLEITPSVNLTVNDIVLHPNSGTLVLDLEPETLYNFALKSYDSEIEGEKTESEKFMLTTPKNTYFGLRKLDKVSLFGDSRPVDFEMVSYDTDKLGAKVKICRISNEDYARIEVFQEQSGMREEKKNFFLQGIDALKAYKCDEKELVFDSDAIPHLNSSPQGEDETAASLSSEEREFKSEVSGGKLKKLRFNFSNLIGEPARSGLYYVTFADASEREYNGRVQEPIFFGIIDSHITMKISRNGQAFFFVNDLAGKPLANQEIRAYANDFIAYEKKWNGPKKDYDISYSSPLEESVFDAPVFLGKTNSEGILEIDMKGKMDNAFDKTFDSWNFDWNGNYDSFFITSASETNLTYVSSKWNGGIAGWNFGYTTGWGWWYGESENMNEIELSRWGQIEPTLYSHSYTDRKLYLPGEEVYIKSVVRNSENLSIPTSKEITLKIIDPKGKESATSTHKVNEYGSITKRIELQNDAILGNYQVYIYAEDEQVGYTGFSVEVFKNPKFKNEVMLQTVGLNNELVENIKETSETTHWGYERKTYSSTFSIKASVTSDYYSGSPVKNAEFTYKVYKQYYYDNSYWDDCYYGCYWEPEKEFYSEGAGKLDANGKANIDIPVEFSSNYSDYKYIVEVTVTDTAGDKISGSNSVIARLPIEYKRWNPESGVYFETDKRFYEAGENFVINGGLTHGDFTSEYNKNFVLIIKKKEYYTVYVKDIRGYDKPITRSREHLEKILPVNDTNFTLRDGKLVRNYNLAESGEYIFEFGEYNTNLFFDATELAQEFTENGGKDIIKKYSGNLEASWDALNRLSAYCDRDVEDCSRASIAKQWGCKEDYIDSDCSGSEANISMQQKISPGDLIESNSRKYFTLISYGQENAKNPVESDNKITVLSEKVSYKLGETARILVRLPFSGGKILWTVEKQGVLEHEYIDVPGNTFFKEVIVDDAFVPNAYIGVVVVDTDSLCHGVTSPSTEGDQNCTPEYKVGYTEIVVDKTDKKSEITITPNKKTYEPREEVTLSLKATKPSELTVMVVDDSLIALMGNIDANALEKFYKKLPFQIQTSITNLGMLKNYYFSRQGIVGGSGFGNFKGGDSAVSSRNIFKNTAYYNPTVITDTFGNAKVSFELPDNLTNFRVMVLGNSKDNFFGYAEEMIEVRKDVIVEDRTPLILRENDEITLGANVFNTTDTEIGFKALISADGLEIDDTEKLSLIPAGESEFISWTVKNPKSCSYLEVRCEIPYTISILGDSAKHSDKVEGKISLKSIPSLVTNSHKAATLEPGESADLSLILPENTDIEKSLYTIALSNNPLQGIEKIVRSLAVYPFGCGEQLLSTTMPNAVLQRFTNILSDTGIKKNTIDENLSYGLEKIYEMSLESGAMKYWYHDTQGNVHITAYAVRVLLEIQDSGTPIDISIVEKAVNYLIANYAKSEGIEKAESLWAITNYHGKSSETVLSTSDLSAGYDVSTMDRHELIAMTYALVLANPEKYTSTIDANIIRIEKLLENGKDGGYYYSKLSDMGEFTQLLIDYNADKKLITHYISEMYNEDWESYWYSTKTKNNAFLAFAKYIEVYGKDTLNTLSVSLNGNTAEVELGAETNSYDKDIALLEALENGRVDLQVTNISGGTLFTSANIESYPADALKIKSFSDGVSLKRNIYEVVDSSNISETCDWDNGNRTCSEASGLKLHSGNTFKKGVTYKIILEATFPEYQRRQNLTMEDYLPSGFTILNSAFKTNEIATSQETSDGWRWSHTEKNPDVVMAHSSEVWGTTARYEYFVRADFAGTFIYPPAVVYLMYQPDTRANTEFRRVVVK